MNRRRLLLVAAAAVAVIGALMVLVYVRGADQRAQEGTETVEVLTAVAPIEVGESVDDAFDSGKIVTSTLAADAVLPTAQSDLAALEGLFATTRIFPGEQIITEKFGGEQQASSPLAIPRDKLAASVELSDPSRVAGFVNPGSEVAVVYTDSSNGAEFSRVLFERVQVLGVGSTTPTTTTTTTEEGAETTEEIPTTLMTLSLDEEQVQKLAFSAQYADQVSFALLTEDSVVEGVGPTVFGNLFED